MLKTEAEYMILLGQRSNGKSYQVKKVCIEDAMKGNKFVYMRRWKDDIKQRNVSSYFDDMPVAQLTKGRWDGVQAIN